MRENIGIGTIIKSFLILWVSIFAVLVVASCVIHKDAIINVVANNMWALLNCLMPPLIMIFAIGYAVRCAFKH